ncbi:MAG: tetratricopeptide repeat protein, partial [Bacteroidetes bacterium]|nr:tetratricopeptide repeat protein [Bacteroidota bacterium]
MDSKIIRQPSRVKMGDAILKYHSGTFFDFLNQIGYIDINESLSMLTSVGMDNIEERGIKPILLAGQGRIWTLEGNLIAAKHCFDSAFAELSSESNLISQNTRLEMYSYICYEQGLFYEILKDDDQANQCFTNTEKNAISDRLKTLALYQLEVLKAKRDTKFKLDRLISFSEYFSQTNSPIIYLLSLHRLGTLYRAKKEYEKAIHFYNTALEIANKNQYNYLSVYILNSIGYLYLVNNNRSKAIEIFETNFKNSPSNYLKVLSLENIAMFYEQNNDFIKAAGYCKRSLNICIKHHVLSRLLYESMYLAEISEDQLQDVYTAKYYHSLGYEHAISHIEQGLTFTGPRKIAIEMCMQFLSRHFPQDKSAHMPEHLFSFSLGKTWMEIKDIFHYNLVMFHKLKTGSGENLYLTLRMKKPTFYSLHRKLANKGFVFPDFRRKDIKFTGEQIIDSLQLYIKNMPDNSWKAANDKF